MNDNEILKFSSTDFKALFCIKCKNSSVKALERISISFSSSNFLFFSHYRSCLFLPNVNESISIITKLMKKFSAITFAERIENFFYLPRRMCVYNFSLCFSHYEREKFLFSFCVPVSGWSLLVVNELGCRSSYILLMQGTITRFLFCSRYSLIVSSAGRGQFKVSSYFLYLYEMRNIPGRKIDDR